MSITNCDMYNQEQKILFRFSPDLDVDFLNDLYGDDFQQAQLIFESTAPQLRSDVALADSMLQNNDVVGLKKIVHKMKPMFGYTGMNETMRIFSDFETDCASAKTATELKERFYHIMAMANKAIDKIEIEIIRLKEHNTLHL
ncbi:MAG TPA: hypothetical protein VIY47_03015 [Ignavibacteriaceae bacterium]